VWWIDCRTGFSCLCSCTVVELRSPTHDKQFELRMSSRPLSVRKCSYCRAVGLTGWVLVTLYCCAGRFYWLSPVWTLWILPLLSCAVRCISVGFQWWVRTEELSIELGIDSFILWINSWPQKAWGPLGRSQSEYQARGRSESHPWLTNRWVSSWQGENW